MASPVVVTRIQNRRGTQTQFDNLYPPGYSGIGGYYSLPGFNNTTYPNVLLPGEIALCTDSRNIFIGNISGEYINFREPAGIDDLIFIPLVFELPPSASFIPISAAGISYSPTPFFSIVYSLTDAVLAQANEVGVDFSRNGELQITALSDPNATLTDYGTEINLTGFSVTFRAVYSGGDVEIQYMHDFPGPLIFSTATIHWIDNVAVAYPTFDSTLMTFDDTDVTFDEGI